MELNTVKPVLAMLPVRNEAKRFLKNTLHHLMKLVAGVVILDDASDDATPEICQSHPLVIRYHRLKESLFGSNENLLRETLWEMTTTLAPEWILALDADEFFSSEIETEFPNLLTQDTYDTVSFPMYHFWNSLSYYRTDGWWNPRFARTVCLCRYRKNLSYNWTNRRLHCGRFPRELAEQTPLEATTPLIHLGYLNSEDRQAKYKRYLSLDPNGAYCPLSHYRSIKTAQPRLRSWTGKKIEVI